MIALELMAAFAAQNRVSRAIGAFFTHHDLLVTPTLAQLPAPHGALRDDGPAHRPASRTRALLDYGPFTAAFNVSGQPAISLPLSVSANGLPIGVQLVAPYGCEDLLLRVASQLEVVMPWKDRRPQAPLAIASENAAEPPARCTREVAPPTTPGAHSKASAR